MDIDARKPLETGLEGADSGVWNKVEDADVAFGDCEDDWLAGVEDNLGKVRKKKKKKGKKRKKKE